MSDIKKVKAPKLSKTVFTKQHSTGIVFDMVVFSMSRAFRRSEFFETLQIPS